MLGSANSSDVRSVLNKSGFKTLNSNTSFLIVNGIVTERRAYEHGSYCFPDHSPLGSMPM